MRRLATKRRGYFWDSDSPWALDLSVVSRVTAPAFFGIFWFAWLVGPIASKVGNALHSISQLALFITTILSALAIFGLFRLRRLVRHVDSRSHWLLIALCFCSWQWAVATGFFLRPPFPSWARVIADLVFLGLCLSGFIVAEQISLRLPQRGRDLVQVLLLVPLLFLLYEAFLLQSGLSSVLVAFLLYGAARIQVAGRIRWRGSKMSLRPVPNTLKLPLADQTGRIIPVISDTHLGPHAADETNKKLERILTALSTMGDRGPFLFTGDLTNEGRLSEWVEWERIVKKYIEGPVLLLPGNHDLLFGRATTMTRSARFLLATYRMLPAETRCYGDDGKTTTPQKVLKPVLNWLEAAAVRWTDSKGGFERRPLIAPRKSLFGLLRSLYPMWWDEPGGPLRIIMLNSCTNVALTFLDNGVGRLGEPQLERLSRLLRKSSRKQLIIALHHQVAFPNDRGFLAQLPAITRFVEWGTFSIQDVEALYNVLQKVPPQPMTIIHGHKHVAYAGLWKDSIRVVSVPSATKRLEARQDGFPTLFGIRTQRAGEWDLVDLST